MPSAAGAAVGVAGKAADVTPSLPLGFFVLGTGGILLIAGVTGSSVGSVVQGKPDRKNSGGLKSASGSLVPGAVGVPGERGLSPTNAHGFANPLPHGFTRGRSDMGIDYSGTPGDRIDAVGPARILGIYSNWYQGQPYVEYEVLGNQGQKLRHETGTDKLYVAEQIVPIVHVDQIVQAGQEIGTYAPSGTGIEFGLGAGGGRTLAQATTGYVEGEITRASQLLSHFLTTYRI